RVFRVIASQIDSVLQYVGRTSAVEAEGEIDIGVRGALVAVTQTGEPERVRFTDGELDVAVARRDLLFGSRTRIVAAVAPARLLQHGARDGRVDEVGPHDVLRGSGRAHADEKSD